jgi:hypothetical protein
LVLRFLLGTAHPASFVRRLETCPELLVGDAIVADSTRVDWPFASCPRHPEIRALRNSGVTRCQLPIAPPRKLRRHGPPIAPYLGRLDLELPEMPGKNRTELGEDGEQHGDHSPSSVPPSLPLSLSPSPSQLLAATKQLSKPKVAPQPPLSQQVLVICRNKCASFPASPVTSTQPPCHRSCNPHPLTSARLLALSALAVLALFVMATDS